MMTKFRPGTTMLGNIVGNFDHISNFTEDLNELLKATLIETKGIIKDDSVKIFTEWSPEIIELEHSLILIPIDNKLSYASDKTDVVFSATFLHYGLPIRTMVLNRYLRRSVRWNAKMKRGGTYNQFRDLLVSSKDSLYKAKVTVLDFSRKSIGYIFDNLKRENAYVTTSKSIAYTAALIADGQKDVAVIIVDDQKDHLLDIAPAMLLVMEAGGKIYNFDGRPVVDPFDIKKGCVLLNNGISFETIKSKVIEK